MPYVFVDHESQPTRATTFADADDFRNFMSLRNEHNRVLHLLTYGETMHFFEEDPKRYYLIEVDEMRSTIESSKATSM
jgi:hypothetical protein